MLLNTIKALVIAIISFAEGLAIGISIGIALERTPYKEEKQNETD